MAWPDYIADLHSELQAEFGELVTYDQPGAEPFDLRVVWTEQAGVTTAWCTRGDFPAGRTPRKDGDTITRGGKLYHVVGVEREDLGGITVELRCRGNA